MAKLSFATIADTDRLMQFMHQEWHKDHILSRNKELFLYDFKEGDQLNLAIATDHANRLIGIFGFMKYNSDDLPDIAGSLWKASDEAGEPMLGLKLREYTVKNIAHRIFSAPGAGLQTRPIYHLINMDWIEMEQHYIPNPTLPTYQLAVIPKATIRPLSGPDQPAGDTAVTVQHVADPDQLKNFPFRSFTTITPFKDWNYLKKRFFEHPIYPYDVYLTKQDGDSICITVCRTAKHHNSSACRIVDFYGDEAGLPGTMAHLRDVMVDSGHEYIDFISTGFDSGILSRSGFSNLDLDQSAIIVPNYFEPFVKKNVRVYAVADKTECLQLRLCKADGDQDRPNT